MMDAFDSDPFFFIFMAVLFVAAALFVVYLILLAISRSLAALDRRRERNLEMRTKFREAKPATELHAITPMNYFQPVQNFWTKVSNAFRTHVPTSPSEEIERSISDSILWELAEIKVYMASLDSKFSEELRGIRGLLEGSVGQRVTPPSSEGSARKKETLPASEGSAGQKTTRQGKTQNDQSFEGRLSLETLYNNCAGDPNKQQIFKQRYILTRIGATNYAEFTRDPNISIEFGEKSDGDFEAIQTKENGVYFVVPRFDLVIQEAKYGPGGVGKAFECRGYSPGETYRRIKLIRPAIFNRNGENWEMTAQGELHLSRGE